MSAYLTGSRHLSRRYSRPIPSFTLRISLRVGRFGVTSSLMGRACTSIPLQLSQTYLYGDAWDSRLFIYLETNRTTLPIGLTPKAVIFFLSIVFKPSLVSS